METFLASHNLQVAAVLRGDLRNVYEKDIMYRIDDENEVVSNLGFKFKAARSTKSAGEGGIYFWTNIEDALKYAHKGEASIIFLVSRPNPMTSNRVAWTYEYMRSRVNMPVIKDIFLDGVSYRWKNKRDYRHEFVKAGNVGDIFRPEILIKLTFKAGEEDRGEERTEEEDDPRT
jgi:hypothetical protein